MDILFIYICILHIQFVTSQTHPYFPLLLIQTRSIKRNQFYHYHLHEYLHVENFTKSRNNVCAPTNTFTNVSRTYTHAANRQKTKVSRQDEGV